MLWFLDRETCTLAHGRRADASRGGQGIISVRPSARPVPPHGDGAHAYRVSATGKVLAFPRPAAVLSSVAAQTEAGIGVPMPLPLRNNRAVHAHVRPIASALCCASDRSRRMTDRCVEPATRLPARGPVPPPPA